MPGDHRHHLATTAAHDVDVDTGHANEHSESTVSLFSTRQEASDYAAARGGGDGRTAGMTHHHHHPDVKPSMSPASYPQHHQHHIPHRTSLDGRPHYGATGDEQATVLQQQQQQLHQQQHPHHPYHQQTHPEHQHRSLSPSARPYDNAYPSTSAVDLHRAPHASGPLHAHAPRLLDLAYNDDAPPSKRAKKEPKTYHTAFGDFQWRDLLKRKWWKYYFILVLISVLIALATIYHDDIIRWLEPISEKIRDIPAGWTIFVGIMFVISFPPLFGHELVAMLCGIIYGLWWGFAIVSLGTILGEWGNYFLFKYACTARCRKWEEQDVNFACIARIIREGGFKIAFMVRLSAIPGHLSTPAFAACGLSWWLFTITAILTMPKQLMAVYLGTVFGEEKPPGITTEKVVEWVVLGISFLITIWAAWYIYAQMAKVRPGVLAEMNEKKAAAEALANGCPPDLEGGAGRSAHVEELGPIETRESEYQQMNDKSSKGFVRASVRPADLDNHDHQQHQGQMRTRSRRSPSGGRWPFSGAPGSQESGSTASSEDVTALMGDSTAPAEYGQGEHRSTRRQRHPEDEEEGYPLRQPSPYHSSSEDELPGSDSQRQQQQQQPPAGYHEKVYKYNQQRRSRPPPRQPHHPERQHDRYMQQQSFAAAGRPSSYTHEQSQYGLQADRTSSVQPLSFPMPERPTPSGANEYTETTQNVSHFPQSSRRNSSVYRNHYSGPAAPQVLGTRHSSDRGSAQQAMELQQQYPPSYAPR